MKKGRKAIIQKSDDGQFFVQLIGDNSKDNINPADLHHNHDEVVKMCEIYFPNFPIVDNSGVKKRTPKPKK